MNNSPSVRLALVGVSRDCFPIELARRRLGALAEACKAIGLNPYVCSKIIESETDAMVASALCRAANVNAAVVFLGNFGPEGPIAIFAKDFKKFCGPVMLCAAAEESGNDLINGRGDALCGLLSAKFNCDLRKVKVHIPRKPVGLPEQLAQHISHFTNVARVMLGLRSLKVIAFGPRPHDFFACNAPIEQLLTMGIEVMENSELDLLGLFEAIKNDDPDVVATAAEMAKELWEGNKHPDLLPRLARLEVCLKRFAEAHKGASEFVVFANKCWPGFEPAFGMVPCYVNGRLAAQGIPVACEVDIFGAISEYICMLAGDSVATLLDLNNSVPADLVPPHEGLLMGVDPEDLFMGFHCGNTAACLMKNCAMCHQLIMHRLMEPGQKPNITRGTLEGQLMPGPVTMFRLQPKIGGGWQSYLAQGNVLDMDPKSFGGIGIIGIPGFERFYRHALLEKGFPHHGAFVFTHAAAAIYDAMQLLGVADISVPLMDASLYPTENPFSLPEVKQALPEGPEWAFRTAKVEELTPEVFAPFGTFHDMIDPKSTDLGKPPIQFFPDVLQLNMDGKSALGISTCLVQERPPVVDVTEFHAATGEGILPLDADVLIHVAEPTAAGVIPWDKIRIFHVPRGTCVVLNPGVWHHAPVLFNKWDLSASTLILLPVRTYANDCRVENLPPEQQTLIIP